MTKRITVSEYDAAITASHGLLAAAARRLNCSRTAVHQAVNRYPSLQQAVETARAEVLDLAESRLFEAVNAGNLTAVMYLLSTVGKNRGYVPRLETDASGFSAREVAAMSDEELAERCRELGIR